MEAVLACESMLKEILAEEYPELFAEDSTSDVVTEEMYVFVRTFLAGLASKVIYEISAKNKDDYLHNIKCHQNDIWTTATQACNEFYPEGKTNE